VNTDKTVSASACEACRVLEVEAPHVIVDALGYEVGVVVDYAHYLGLLGVLATQIDRGALPPYWRAALDRCFSSDIAARSFGRSQTQSAPLRS
jgi:hypothetical protein